jgi:hypothetical protein
VSNSSTPEVDTCLAGLPLLPLQTQELGVIDSTTIRLSSPHKYLLPKGPELFIDVASQPALNCIGASAPMAFSRATGTSRLTPLLLAENLGKALPAGYKGRQVVRPSEVEWEQNQPLICKIWEFLGDWMSIHLDGTWLEAFKIWPILATQDRRLFSLSCGQQLIFPSS